MTQHIFYRMYAVLSSILCYDIWFYISHRLLHRRTLWPYHRLHHTAIYPTFLDTYRGHWVESALQSLGTFVPMLVLPYTFLDIVLVLTFLNIRGMLRHDYRWAWFIGNHHLLHHEFPQYNYGEYWLDYCCGTLYQDNNGRSIENQD